MTRYVLPDLFHAVGAPIIREGRERLALRFMIHPSLGLPRALFHVWALEKSPPTKSIKLEQRHLDTGARLIAWTEGQAAAVALRITVPAGGRMVLRARSGPLGTGAVVDEEVITGPVTNAAVILLGSSIASVTVQGGGTIDSSATIVPLGELINHGAWKLVETVGLPADRSFVAGGYPLDRQGPPGAELPPFDAAIRRIKEGTPDAGWPATTDRGTPVEPYAPPDPALFVEKEIDPIRAIVSKMLTRVPDPTEHAAYRLTVKTNAPRSVHGVDASERWQDAAEDADVSPLTSLLMPAATDSVSALALGFGTTLDIGTQYLPDLPTTHVAAANPKLAFFMVTVKHDVDLKLPPPLPDITVPLRGELAALFVEAQREVPAAPTALTALTPADAVRMDPPARRDDRWLEVVRLKWAAPENLVASKARPTGYIVARGLGTAPLSVRLERRQSGGYIPHVPAQNPREEAPVTVPYTEAGLPERFPSEPASAVYAVAATDWFGRFSGFVSADHPRVQVAPTVPALKNVEVTMSGAGTTRDAVAHAELTWDWSHRSPDEITVRVLTHRAGTPPPAASGSVLSVGGPTRPDLILDFSSATIDAPPAGVSLIASESLGNLRTYRVSIPGLRLDFGANDEILVTARASAKERVGFRLASAWSQDKVARLPSPIAPPSPFVPEAMCWASLPDPRGVARRTLSWDPSAPSYIVYEADETAIRRELGVPSADLEISAADRLAVLRTLDFASARRAFKRIAGPLTKTEHQIELPRGSRLIHFFAITGISATGVESTLPAAANSYIAVAAPVMQKPESPRLLARDHAGAASLTIEVPETRVPVARVAIHRAPSRARATTVEHIGPPIAVLDAALGTRAGELLRVSFEDPTPGRPFEPVFYRAVAHAQTSLERGIFGGASAPSRATELVPTSPSPPTLTDLRVESRAGAPEHLLVSFLSDATLAETARGVHVFTVITAGPDADIATRRVAASVLPLVRSSSLPAPATQSGNIFRYHATDPRTGRTYAWVPHTTRAVTVEIKDPLGRAARQTWSAS